MRKITLLIIILSILPVTQADAQEDGRRYRVELIVLQHLDHDEEPRELKWLDDHSAALDFLTPPPEEEALDEAAGEVPEMPVAADDAPAPSDDAPGTSPGTAAGEMDTAEEPLEEPLAPGEETDPLDEVVHVPELGEQMQDAWRRLRLSGPFRPLQYLAWEQSAAAPFPTLRVHDQELVLVQDPWAAERAERETLEAEQAATEAAAFGDVPADEAADEAADGATDEAADEAELPPPVNYYRLDGTATLTRTRFLHLALDLEWREPVFEAPLPGQPAPPMPASAGDETGTPAVALPPVPDAFRVYRLEQTRQVRTGRMEYFDGPVLGVLAWISRVAAPDEESSETTGAVDLSGVD